MLPGRAGEYTLRAATPEDAPRVAACARAAYERWLDGTNRVPVPYRQDYAEVIRGGWQVVVVECEATIVGLLVMGSGSDGFLLDNVAVLPSHQGTGLGRFLLRYAEAEALRRGFDSVYLYTQERMTTNLDMYRKNGYVKYARRQEFGLHRVYLRKQLAGQKDH